MLELYNAPQSTCSQKVRLTLAEKGLEFIEHKLRLFRNDQLKPEYLKLNPNGVVPTLVDGGVPIIDSSVIMEYLDEEHPKTSLTPHFAKMSDDEFHTLAKSKPLRDKFLGEMDKTKGFSADRLKGAEDSIRKTVARMEPSLAASDYLLGPKLTLADFCVLPAMIRMEDLGYEFLWEDKPGVKAWLARIKTRPSFKRAFYSGSLLSEQYPGIRVEHQMKRMAAFGDAA